MGSLRFNLSTTSTITREWCLRYLGAPPGLLVETVLVLGMLPISAIAVAELSISTTSSSYVVVRGVI